MKTNKIFVSINVISLIMLCALSAPSFATCGDEESILPGRRGAYKEETLRMAKGLLEVQEGVTGIKTKCQRLERGTVTPCAMFDDRQRIQNPQQWPYSVHGYMETRYADGRLSKGTGTLIGPGLVLTCAHNLCRTNEVTGALERADSVVFYPGRNQAHTPSEIKASSFYYPDDYRSMLSDERQKELIKQGVLVRDLLAREDYGLV